MTTADRKCCRHHGVIPGGDGQEERMCFRHADEDTRRLWRDLLEEAAPTVGVPRPASVRTEWPYGPNIRLDSRAAMVSWAQDNSLRLSTGSRCLHWLIGDWRGGRTCGRCRCQYGVGAGFDELQPAGIDISSSVVDHVTSWVSQDGEVRVLVLQPYGLDERDVAALELLGTKAGLRVEIDEAGGWYGLGTAWVAIWCTATVDLDDPPPVCSGCGAGRAGAWYLDRLRLQWYCGRCVPRRPKDITTVHHDDDEAVWLTGTRDDLRRWRRMATFLHEGRTEGT